MKRFSILNKMLSVLPIFALMLAACAPGQPVPSAEEIESAIKTSVAQTVEAQGEIATSVALTVAARESEAAKALPTATLSPTPLPTLTPVLATATPFSSSGGSSGSGGSGGSGGGGKADYSCDVIRQRPIDNTVLSKNDTEADVSFALLNNGKKTWEQGWDLIVLEDHGVINFTMLELPNDLAPGGIWEIGPYDMTIPQEKGFYVIDFQFKMPNGWCYPYVAFYVGQP